MPSNVRAYFGSVVADLAANRLRNGERIGAIVENLPAVDPNVFLRRLAEHDLRCRVAILGGNGTDKHAQHGITITTDPNEANRWRNTVDEDQWRPLIVLVLGPTTKLASLRTTLWPIGETEVREAISDRATALLHSPERRAFWAALADMASEVSTNQLIAFANAIESVASSKAALLDSEWREVHRVGLLPEEQLLQVSGRQAARRAIRRNLSQVGDIRELTPARRKRVVTASEDDDSQRAEAAMAILRFERTGDTDHLAQLTRDLVTDILRKEPGSSTANERTADTGRPERVEGNSLAIELMLAGGRGIKTAAERFGKALEDEEHDTGGETITVGSRVITPRPRVGTAQSETIIARLVSADSWGGYIAVPTAVDLVSALKAASTGEGEVTDFLPHEGRHLVWMLRRAISQGITDAAALDVFTEYAEIRQSLLSFSRPLIDHPLLTLGGNSDVRQAAERLVNLYPVLLQSIENCASSLWSAGSVDAAKRLRAYFLALDAMFIRTRAEFVALTAPVHPFHLWRWLSLLQVLEEHNAELRDIGLDAVEPILSDPPSAVPNLVLSPFALGSELGRAHTFVPIGSFGALALYGESGSRQAAKFRTRSIAALAKRFLRLVPHASYGLRIVLVDPPSIAGIADGLVDLQDTIDPEYVVPLHLIVLRTRHAGDSTEEEDSDIAELWAAIRDGGGTIKITSAPRPLAQLAEQLREEHPHMVIAFDPGDAQEVRVGINVPPPLSPLVVTRAYRYDPFDDRLDVVVAGDDQLFSAYHALLCEVLDLPLSDYLGQRSGASRLGRTLEVLAGHSLWLVVVDQGVEPTLQIGGAVRLDWRTDSGRDVITYTVHQDIVEDLVADALRVSGLLPNDILVKRTLNQLIGLSGEALLALAKQRHDVGLADPRVAKGLLGVLRAVEWYESIHPDALVITLDEPASRSWILGSNDDNRQGDLLAVRVASGGIAIDCIEVKAHDSEDAGVRVHGGRVEGRPVTQVDQSIRILRRILAPGEQNRLDAARSAMLRDQLYRTVASRPMASERRGRMVRMLEELFENGPIDFEGLVIRVAVRPNERSSGPSSAAYAMSPDGNRIGIVDLVASDSVTEYKWDEQVTQAVAETVPREADRESPQPLSTSTSGSDDTSGSESLANSRITLQLGTTPNGDAIHWDPHQPDAPLNNFGILVTGDSGTGKTQFLRSLVSCVAGAGLPVCIFDFKNDYSDDGFAAAEGLQVFDISRGGLPFNPLALVAEDNGDAQPIRQIHELSGILRRIFGLGDQQEALLKKGLQEAYEARGIRVQRWIRVEDSPTPPMFDEVVDVLASMKKTEPLLNRLSPLFDLGLFPSSQDAAAAFDSLLEQRVVLDLHALPGDKIKSAVAEFVIVRLHGHVLRGSQPRELRRLILFDEAWRISASERLQELAREGRAFGVGVAVGTQFPGDLPEALTGNLASHLFLGNTDIEHRKSVVRTLIGSATGGEATRLIQQVGELQKHEGFFRNQHYSPYALLRSTPYYERVKG